MKRRGLEETETWAVLASILAIALLVGVLIFSISGGLNFGCKGQCGGGNGNVKVYGVITGHRDTLPVLSCGSSTILEQCVHIDSVSYTLSNPPAVASGSGSFTTGFTMTVTLTSSSGQVIGQNTFFLKVAVGGQFTEVVTYQLSPGGYTLSASGQAADGYSVGPVSASFTVT